MNTPYELARAAAAAVAASPDVQSFCLARYGSAPVVYLGGTGTSRELAPPWVCVTLESSDGETTGPERAVVVLEVRLDSGIDPATGERLDPSKAAAAEGGVREVGRGDDLVSFVRLCASAAASASPRAFAERRSFAYRVGGPAGDSAACELTFRLAVGLFAHGSAPPALLPLPPRPHHA